MNNVKSYNEFNQLNEEHQRITWGEEKVYDFTGTPEEFVRKYRNTKDGVDIFFTNDGQATVTKRSYNLTAHGSKSDQKYIKDQDVKYVWGSYEDEFWTPEDYKKMLGGVYYGKNSRYKTLSVNQLN